MPLFASRLMQSTAAGAMLLLGAFAAQPAQAAVVVCSENVSTTVHFAMARFEEGRIYVRGWYNVSPNSCITVDEGYAAGPYSFYAYSSETLQQWPPTERGVRHCTKFGERFTVRYPMAAGGDVICPDGYATRFFQRFDPVNGEIRVVLR
jgi:uncharacterized membrane protein